MRLYPGLIALLAFGMPAVASAGPCPEAVGWTVIAGTLAPGARCGEHVLTTEPSNTDASRASVLVGEHLTGDVELALRWQILDSDAPTLQLQIPGGYLLTRADEIGLYIDEARWATHGYAKLPTPSKRGAAASVRVHIHDHEVTAWVDQNEPLTWALPSRPADGSVAIGIVGARGHRTRVLVSDVSVPRTGP